MSQTGGYITQKRQLEDGREGGQGPTRTVEPWSSSKRVYAIEHTKTYTLHRRQNVVKLNSVGVL